MSRKTQLGGSMKTCAGFAASFAVLVNFLAVNSVRASEKEFVYVQKTGILILNGKEVGTGYSGNGEAKNDPAKEMEKDVGPIPAGLWKIGKARDFKGMKNCFDLSPDGHDAHKRTEFLIHGDSKNHPGTASEGCIILDAATRQKIADSGVTTLRVVPE
jgi:hypothetical protein